MLVCNVSLLHRRAAITAELAEAAAAVDTLGTGNIVFATLVDDPASVNETVDAFLGEIMVEAASASDQVSASLPAVLAADVAESAAAASTEDATSGVPTTWNASDKSANIVLSNGNLTSAASTNTDGAVRSTNSRTSGKLYFEITWSATAGTNSGCGIANSTTGLGTVGPTASGGFLVYSGGNIYFNGSFTGAGIIFAPGDTICFAIDLVNSRAWARRNGGNWNNSTTDNPATATGGTNISALFPTAPAFAISIHNSTTTTHTANFGASAFAQTPPSGFSAWQ
jgi:hypothetical protein